MKNYILLALVAAMMFACSKDEYSSALFNEKFTINNFTEIVEKVKADRDISAENITYLNNGLKRLSFFKDSIVGKTVKEVILSEKAWVHDYANKDLAKTADISILKLNTTNNFYGVVKAVDQANKDYNRLYFIFNNKYNKPIKRLAGEVLFFYRPEGSEQQVQLEPMEFSYTDKIRANAIDTIIFNQPFEASNQAANLFRNETSRISGVLNIMEVEFEK